jgi:hypothetical protein
MFLDTAIRTPISWAVVAGFCALGASSSAQAAASPNGSVIPTESGFVDSTGATWTVFGGHALKNGTDAGATADIAKLLYFNTGIYQLNTKNLCFKWNGTSWPAVSDPRTVSTNNTDATSASYLVDGGLNIWTIVGGHIYENGATAGTTADVTDIIYSDGKIYQKNSFGNYFYWNGTSWPATVNPLGPTPPAQASMYPVLKYNYNFAGLTTATLESSNTIDLGNTQNPGYQWYRKTANIPLTPSTTAAADTTSGGFTITDAGGITALHISGTSSVGNNQYCISTTNYSTSKGVGGASAAVGATVAPGQWGGPSNPGFYAEARVAFATPSATNHMMIPAVWMMQTLADNNITWPGDAHAGYNHNVEIDMMEYDLPETFTMGTTLIDWFGYASAWPSPSTLKGYQGINSNKIGNVMHLGGTPANARLNGQEITIYSTSDTAPVYHSIGTLVTPLAAGSGKGSIQFYWDDVLYGRATYTANTQKGVGADTPTPAAGVDWLYAGVEDNPYGMVIEAGSGAWTNVQYVHVWQAK